MKKGLFLILMIGLFAFGVLGCTRASVAAYNISKAADQFEVYRRVVFYNGITDAYILLIEGYCSVNTDEDGDFYVVVKTGPDTYLKHYLGLSDNVTFFAQQLETSQVSDDRYRVIFKPSVIIPNIDFD